MTLPLAAAIEPLSQLFLGNTVQAWGIALGTAAAAFLALVLVRRVAIRKFEKAAPRTPTHVDDLAVAQLKSTRYFFLLVLSLELGSLMLEQPVSTKITLRTFTVIATLVQVGLWLTEFVRFWAEEVGERSGGDAGSRMTISVVAWVGRVVLWTIVLLLVLENLGVDVTALVTGLGIGGVAVALSVQNVLGDVFAALSIMLDKPFVVGDQIDIGGIVGTVEDIGMKSTRLRSVTGELVIVSNGDLLKSRIRNNQRAQERRVLFTIGVVYSTPPDTLARIPTMIEQIIAAQENTRFDRSHFSAFGDSGLLFETVYHITNRDYKSFMDAQQQIYLELARRFAAEHIDFAFPTRTVLLSGAGVGDAMPSGRERDALATRVATRGSARVEG
ncbi:MAG TPA: mechanosensitive ion channel family protein [Gemmatimonadaceae bacterium]|nr:mechanosensitive ion channel family protein [Gemmatimonadaceae bacterium]